MDWLRWWHGTVTDPKFQWVARKSGQPVGSVIAVWAALLECASTATQGNADATRGNVASFDCNDYDVALGFEDGTVKSIYSAMEKKGLIADGVIAKWNERQPKREDSGNPNTGALSSTERSRLRREKLKRDATQCNDMQRNATLGNDRGEERREELTPPSSPPARAREADDDVEADAPPIVGEPFAMTADWQPSAHLPELARQGGLVLNDSEAIAAARAEFVAYWLTQPRRRTQHEWDHALIKSLKAERLRPQVDKGGAQPRQRAAKFDPVAYVNRGSGGGRPVVIDVESRRVGEGVEVGASRSEV